jgi:uncharacterized membrane protein YgdD (TMEM256/DUF423 family)
VSPLRWAGVGAVLAGLAVLAGAFGAHALRARLGEDSLAVWETAARYQMYHGLALLGAITPLGGAALLAGWVCFALALFRARPADAPTP